MCIQSLCIMKHFLQRRLIAAELTPHSMSWTIVRRLFESVWATEEMRSGQRLADTCVVETLPFVSICSPRNQ
jgi:hypothetical protein